MEQRLTNAIRLKNLVTVREILARHPELDLNHFGAQSPDSTPLHEACRLGHTDIVSLLLGHPGIDVNPRNSLGETPFYHACLHGHSAVVKLLMKDSRVDVNCAARETFSSLWWVAFHGKMDILRWMIASGIPLNVGRDDAGAAGVLSPRKHASPEVSGLLERFKRDPAGTRVRIRLELGFYDEEAAQVFALVVFVCDGLLVVSDAGSGDHWEPQGEVVTGQGDCVEQGRWRGRRREGEDEVEDQVDSRKRFFRIAMELPLELQMVLCHRVTGSAKISIPSVFAEAAFRDLTKVLRV